MGEDQDHLGLDDRLWVDPLNNYMIDHLSLEHYNDPHNSMMDEDLRPEAIRFLYRMTVMTHEDMIKVPQIEEWNMIHVECHGTGM